MARPSIYWTQVGVQDVRIFPYNGAAGPYDITTANILGGLQNIDLNVNVTDVQGFGGESVYELFSAEVKREIDLKFAAFIVNLETFQLILGGRLSLDPANVNGLENQYLTWGQADRAKLFRLECTSNVGTGTVKMVFPKLRVSGGFSWSWKMEGINIPDLSARALLDKTFVTQDGQTGAPFDMEYSDGTQGLTRHS